MDEVSGVQSGWAKPTPVAPQLALFGNERDEVLVSARVSVDDLKRWHDKDWISFSPTLLESLDDAQVAEVWFVRDLARAGLPDDTINRLLAEPPKPYAYSHRHVAYSFAFGWVQRQRPPDMGEMLDTHLSDWIAEQVEDGDLARMRSVLEELQIAMSTYSNQSGDPEEEDSG